MLDLHSRLHRNDEEVAAKVMDGEAIIINLSSGMYYSMGSVGGEIWSMIESGWRLDEMVAALASRYEVSAERATEDLERLAEQLLGDRLVRITEDTGPAATVTPPHGGDRRPYRTPALEVYSDMADLLALDPPVPSLEDISWEAPPGGRGSG